MGEQTEPEYYSQLDSPLGRRQHLELVRRGKLQGFKVGKRVLVRRDVMRDFIERRPARDRARLTAADILAGALD